MTTGLWYLDEDPRLAAQALDDWDVYQMTSLSLQSLCAAHYILDSVPTKVTLKHKETGQDSEVMLHMFHDERDNFLATFYKEELNDWDVPTWTRLSVENYNWMVEHFFALLDEYQYRFKKTLDDYKLCGFHLQSPPHGLREWDFVPPISPLIEGLEGGDIISCMRAAYCKTSEERVWSLTSEQPGWFSYK